MSESSTKVGPSATAESPPSEKWRVGQIEVKNWRSVRHIIWTPLNGWNEIAGENESGKTQFLAAWACSILGGSPGADVVRHGEELAEVRTRLDGNGGASLFIEKLAGARFPSGWRLYVRTSPEGKPLSDGQTVLNRIVGAMVDPSRLVTATPEKRIEMLLKALGLGDQLHELEVREKHLTWKREDLGRKSRDRKGELEGIPVSPGDTPADFIDTASLLEEKNRREKTRRDRLEADAEYKRKRTLLETAASGDVELERTQAELPAQIEAQRQKVDALFATGGDADSELEPLRCRKTALISKIAELQDTLKVCTEKIAALESTAARTRSEWTHEKTRLDELEAEPAKLEAALASQRQKIAALDADCNAANPDAREWGPTDTADIDTQLAGSKEINAHVADNKRRAGVAQAKREIDADWDRLDVDIKSLKDQRVQLLATAPWPYPGLGFGEGDITVNGALWPNLSRAQVVKVSTAFAIATNPLLRTVVLTDAAWMTPKTKRIVRDMVTQAGYQALVEIPGEDKDATLIIDDGLAVGPIPSPIKVGPDGHPEIGEDEDL